MSILDLIKRKSDDLDFDIDLDQTSDTEDLMEADLDLEETQQGFTDVNILHQGSPLSVVDIQKMHSNLKVKKGKFYDMDEVDELFYSVLNAMQFMGRRNEELEDENSILVKSSEEVLSEKQKFENMYTELNNLYDSQQSIINDLNSENQNTLTRYQNKEQELQQALENLSRSQSEQEIYRIQCEDANTKLEELNRQQIELKQKIQENQENPMLQKELDEKNQQLKSQEDLITELQQNQSRYILENETLKLQITEKEELHNQNNNEIEKLTTELENTRQQLAESEKIFAFKLQVQNELLQKG